MPTLHRFSRTEILIGPEGVAKLGNSSVALFGLGGVGSYAAEALCRAGVGRITIVDFDDICLTNVNRQLHALDGSIGKAKAHVMAERMRLINPQAEITPYRKFYSSETSNVLLSGRHQYILDAIDHFTSKIHLIKSCRERGLPIISSMGAAMKRDPTLIRVADISETSRCRMARSVRKLLRKEGIEQGVTVVYSTEEFRSPAGQVLDSISPGGEEQQGSGEYRRITLGSIAPIPAIFGLTMAGIVINALIDR
jgi:tRNA A37 threonylcarbamoyladenosine dehydratase